MRIAFLGDSLIEGRYGGSLLAALARRLPEHSLLNFGVNGSTVLNLLERLDDVLAAEAEVIVIHCGGNDAISASQPATRPYYARAQRAPAGVVTLDAYAAACRELLTRIQLAYVLPRVLLPTVEVNQTAAAALTAYNAAMQAACESLGVPTLALAGAFPPVVIPPERPALDVAAIQLIGQRIASGWADYEAARAAGGYAYTFDGLHLTPAAAEALAEHVRGFVAGE